MNFLRKIALLVIVIFAVMDSANAQNLIADPGFEDWDNTISPNPNTLGSLTHWYNTNGTADHHHQLNPPGVNLTSLEDCPTGEGMLQCGMPYEGQAVLGCYKGNGPDGVREWAGIQLSEPMVAGGCYEISFWIQNKTDRPGNEYVTNQWGLFFDHDQFPFFNPNVANYATRSDHWVACEEVIDGSDWVKVEFDYQASEAFAYAHVGYMGDFSTSTYSVPNNDPSVGYYVWIDQVVITRIDPQLTLTEDINICKGDSVTLVANSNFLINWEDNNSAGTSRTLSPDTTTTYYIQTLDSTLCSVRDSIVVTILDAQVIDFMGQSICEGADPLVLAPNITSGTWNGPGITDATQGLFDPEIAGTGEFFITYTSNADCSENFIMKVEVSSAPVIDLEADFLEGCPPLDIQFNDSGLTPGIAYQWNLGNGTFSDDLLTTSTTYTELGEYDLSLEVVYSENCKSTFTASSFIKVFDPPEADFTYRPFVPSNLMPFVQFDNTSTGDITEVFWDFGNGDVSESFEPETTFDLPGNYDVQLWVTSFNNCTDSITRQIRVNSEIKIYIPNAFSPNGDGINDLFEVNAVGPILEYEIIIFDRWGGIVYKSNNIDDSWDGNISGGKKSGKGVYTYLINYTYQGSGNDLIRKEKKSGDVMILR